MSDSLNAVIQLLKCAIWHTECADLGDCNWKEIDDIVKAHSITGLMGSIDNRELIPKYIKDRWSAMAAVQIVHNNSMLAEQDAMISILKNEGIPVIILKGSASAQYYPRPELRTMGDIDFIVPRDQYEEAFNVLEKSGFSLIKKRYKTERNIKLLYNGVIYELHRYFGTSNNAGYAKELDDLIFDSISNARVLEYRGYRIPVLPTYINGLVILQHINQHIESGIGLRQIIDWMLFYSKNIETDDDAKTFYEYVERVGLERLEKYITGICVIYLGLNTSFYSKNVDRKICKQLIDYIFASGNFGKKINKTDSEVITVLQGTRSIKQSLYTLHKYGYEHWEAAHKYRVLIPFSCIYQIIYYLSKGIKHHVSLIKFFKLLRTTKEQKKMFEVIGAKTKDKGSVAYIDGKYEIR